MNITEAVSIVPNWADTQVQSLHQLHYFLLGLRLGGTLSTHQVQLMVRGDLVAMLTRLVNMRPHSPQMRIIAQELALEMAHYLFVRLMAHHIPGIANVVADELSRWPQPGHIKKIPVSLANAVQVFPDDRTATYYRCRSMRDE